MRCNTLGKLLFMRVPLPAAMMTTSTGGCGFSSLVSVVFKGAVMRVSFWFWRIIGLCTLSLLLAGCSAVRIGYSQLPEISYWWIDSYIDTADTQAARLRRELDELFQWHRSTELPQYALGLQRMQKLAPGPISPEQACAEFDAVRERFNALTTRAESAVLWLAPSLSAAQIDHLAAKYAKTNKEWEADWLRARPPSNSGAA